MGLEGTFQSTLDIEVVDQNQISLFNGQILLNPSISKLNFYAFLSHTITFSLVIIPVQLFQIPLLGNHYNLPLDDQRTLMSILNLVNLILKIFLASFFGKLCDTLGRKPMIIFGVIGLAGTVFLMPHLPGVYPYYILLSIVVDIAALSLTIPPLLADYIDYDTKGRAAGGMAVLTYLSAFVSTYFNQNINFQEDLTSRFHLCAILILVLGLFIATFGLKGGLYHKIIDKKVHEAKRRLSLVSSEDENHTPLAETGQGEMPPGFQAGIQEARNNPWILTGYICAFVSAAHIGLSGYVLITYMSHLAGEAGESQAITLTNVQLGVSVVFALIFGFYTDKYNKFKIIVILLLSSMLNALFLILTPTPFHFFAYFAAFWNGIASSGFLTLTTQVLSKYPSEKYRASVGAVGSIFSVIGNAIINIIGMFLSTFEARTPFLMYLAIGAFGSFFLFDLYRRKRTILDNL